MSVLITDADLKYAINLFKASGVDYGYFSADTICSVTDPLGRSYLKLKKYEHRQEVGTSEIKGNPINMAIENVVIQLLIDISQLVKSP